MSSIQVPRNWTPRPYQIPLWKFLENGGRFAAAVWHRRAGKDLFALAWIARCMVLNPGIYWHMLPKYTQGRKVVWDGRTNTGRRFLDLIPSELIQSTNENDMKLKLINGSIYQVVGSDGPDRLVGANPKGVVFSEWSLTDESTWNLTVRPMLVANKGWALFIYTPRGQNHGYTLYECALNSREWFAQILTVNDTCDEKGNPIVSLDDIHQCRQEGMPEALVQQEFYCSFNAPMIGAYYGPQMARAMESNRITNVPWEPNAEVHTAWDLGMGDSTVIWFFQAIGHEMRLIDYYEKNGEGLAHYAKILREKPYVYGQHYAPHDIEVRELSIGKSRWQVAYDLGIRFQIVPKHAVEDGIEAVRSMLERSWFDKEKCKAGIQALKEYRSDYNEQKRVFQPKPLHDWASHAADAFRYLAMGFKAPNRFRKNLQSKTIDTAPIFLYK